MCGRFLFGVECEGELSVAASPDSDEPKNANEITSYEVGDVSSWEAVIWS